MFASRPQFSTQKFLCTPIFVKDDEVLKFKIPLIGNPEPILHLKKLGM